MATITPANASSPFAIVHYFVDESGTAQQVTAEVPYPIQQSAVNNLLSTAGTTTIDPSSGVLYGANVLTAGTNSTLQLLDGTNVLTGTFTDTATGALALGIPAGIGLRYLTSLVAIVTGTAVSTAAIYTA